MKRHLTQILIITILIFGTAHLVRGATIYVTSNDVWSNLSPTPTVSDVVTIKNGAIVTIDVINAVCYTLNLGKSGSNAGGGTIVFNSGSKLYVDNSINIANNGYNGVVDMTNGGTLAFADISIGSGTANFTPGIGTVTLKPNSSLTLPSGFTTYNNLIQDSTGTSYLGTNIIVNGNLEVRQGMLNPQNYLIEVQGNLSIAASSTLKAPSSNGIITMSGGNWSNSGTFDWGTSEVIFSGTSGQSITGATTFYDLTVNGTMDLTIKDDVTVNNELELLNKNIVLGADNLILGTDASIVGGSTSSYIEADGTGEVKKKINVLSSFTYLIGDADNFSPFSLVVGSGTVFSADPTFGVNVTNAVHGNVEPSRGSFISRYWTLNASGFDAVSYRFTATYTDADINGNESEMKSTRWDGSAWNNYAMADAGSNTILSASNITIIPSLDDFTGGGAGALALPIQLLSFTASKVGSEVLLSWATAVEIDNEYFTLERSINGVIYTEIASITGAGNSMNTIDYEYIDERPLNGVSYYRLKQTDYDGTYSYTQLVSVSFESSVPTAVSVYPNPVASGQTIHVTLEGFGDQAEVLVVLLDPFGRKVYSKVVIQDNDKVLTAIDQSHKLAAGIYFVIGSSINNIHYKKLVITSGHLTSALVRK